MPDVESHIYAAKRKYRKAEVRFEHPAQRQDHCGQCKHFEVEAARHCEIVAGVIEAADWCDKFRRK